MNYLKFLQILLALGPKLPAIVEKVQHIIEDVQAIIALLQLGPFAASGETLFTATPEELAVESEVMAAIAPTGAPGTMKAIGDGAFLRRIWTFVQEHPELLTLLLSLLAKKA